MNNYIHDKIKNKCKDKGLVFNKSFTNYIIRIREDRYYYKINVYLKPTHYKHGDDLEGYNREGFFSRLFLFLSQDHLAEVNKVTMFKERIVELYNLPDNYNE